MSGEGGQAGRGAGVQGGRGAGEQGSRGGRGEICTSFPSAPLLNTTQSLCGAPLVRELQKINHPG
ncbi:hypothetical protein JYQ62_14335 [Nostoc sp. UHCC 0702]|nr:hypothetical protein JYQ62_14335 [Nostoc sp. UHCC 0702]